MRWLFLLAAALGCGQSGVPEAIVANPAPSRFTLRLSSSGPGAIRGTQLASDCRGECQLTADAGTTIHLEAAGDPEAMFKGWSGACTGTGACDLVVRQDAAVTGFFEKAPKPSRLLEVTVNGAGSVRSDPPGIDCPSRCAANFDDGTVVRLTATSNPGNDFSGFGGGCTGPACAVTLGAARKVWATFVQRNVTLTVQVDGDGRLTSSPARIDCSKSCTAAFAPGTAVSLTPLPAPGQRFTGFRGACSGGTCSMQLTADAQVFASFAPIPWHQLTVAMNGSGRGRVTSIPAGIDCPGACTGHFLEGTGVTLAATGDVLSRFAQWSGACSGARCAVTLAADTAAVAQFDQRRYRVLDVGEQGGLGSWNTASAISQHNLQIVGSWGPSTAQVYLWSWATQVPSLQANGNAMAVNDNGVVVGAVWSQTVSAHAYRWERGVLTNLSYPGAIYSDAEGINNDGVVVGRYWSYDGPFAYVHAVSWNAKGDAVDLGSLGGAFSSSEALGINAAGIIVGLASTSDGQIRRPVRFSSPGVVDDLGTLGGSYGVARAISDTGLIVGESTTDATDKTRHGFFYEKGRMTDIGSLPGMETSTLYSVNAAGLAVGACFGTLGVRGVVYGGGRLVDLNTVVDGTDWIVSYATGVDGAGNIAADGYRNGISHVLLLLPE